MMKLILKLLLLFLLPLYANGQQSLPDSLGQILKNTSNDSVRYRVYHQFLLYYDQVNIDSALYFSENCLLVSKKNKKKIGEAEALAFKGFNLLRLGQYAPSLQCLLQAFEIAKDPENEKYTWEYGNNLTQRKKRLSVLGITHNMYAHLMGATGNTSQQIFHFKQAKNIAEEIGDSLFLGIVNLNLEHTYIDINRLDSALIFEKEAEYIANKTGSKIFLSHILKGKGDIYLKKGDKESAKFFYYEGIKSGKDQNNVNGLLNNQVGLINYYLSERDRDSSLYYSKEALKSLNSLGIGNTEYNIGAAYENLYRSYQLRSEIDSAYTYLGMAMLAKDSLSNIRIKSLSDFQSLSFQEQLRLRELEKEKIAFQNRVRTYTIIIGLAMVILITIILYRNNRQKQKINDKLKKMLSDLTATQTQLIQSEKMASLGELTAGIAHEIQNPLNFVNNFSEVSMELIEEVKSEKSKAKSERSEELENELLDDISQNLRKISHHGKRADFIVKGMLQHSRTSTGEKQLSNINTLAEEFLKLSYHGLRAMDKTFNAELITNLDENLPKVNVVQQDIGRVLLNLFNNAFYAVKQRAKTSEAGYKPKVEVSTSFNDGFVTITVNDNGFGIPEAIKEKIMQPFFTTKPTGEGTRLGLSLSYDIIKAHGGEIKVETRPDRAGSDVDALVGGDGGSEFIIQLPL